MYLTFLGESVAREPAGLFLVTTAESQVSWFCLKSLFLRLSAPPLSCRALCRALDKHQVEGGGEEEEGEGGGGRGGGETANWFCRTLLLCLCTKLVLCLFHKQIVHLFPIGKQVLLFTAGFFGLPDSSVIG